MRLPYSNVVRLHTMPLLPRRLLDGYAGRPTSRRSYATGFFSAIGRHHPEQCRESDGTSDCCPGVQDGHCAEGYEKVNQGLCGHGHAWCDAHACLAYECHEAATISTLVIVLIVLALLTLYIGPMGGMLYCILQQSRLAASGILQCGHVQAPAGTAVDIPSDSCAPDSLFTAYERREMLPADIRRLMAPVESVKMFERINASLRDATGFRPWHIVLWIPMFVFWPIGCFMLLIWGIELARNLTVAAVGKHIDPLCKARNISYVLMLATQPGKHGGQARPTLMRFVLPVVDVASTTYLQRDPAAQVHTQEVYPVCGVVGESDVLDTDTGQQGIMFYDPRFSSVD
ncbi:unnamed protein product [Amoebophrya sp. A25]|nr:unnamed protein product [Amoebophrya sp. A25]|eukprot:GSA25T00015738001.1